MLKSFTIVSGLIFLSRIFGYFRDVLLASYIGPGPVADALFLAFRLPNTFRRLFAEGAFNAAFIPIFTKLWHHNRKNAAFFASNAISYLLIFLVLLTTLFEIFMPQIIRVLAVGFDSDEKFAIAIYYARLMFPYILLVSLSSVFMAILNSMNYFGVASASALILNLNAVLFVLVVGHPPEAVAEAFSWSIPLSGILKLTWLYIVCRRHIVLKIWRPRWTPSIQNFFRKLLPGIYGAGIFQINMISSDIIASFTPAAISYLSFADRINQFPLGLIGASIGLVILPTLSKSFAQKKHAEAMSTQNKAIFLSIFLCLPAACGIFILAEPIVKMLYQHSDRFRDADVIATAHCLKAFIIGLPAFVLVKVLTNNYFARGDTKTPVKLTTLILCLNILLNIGLSWIYSYVGIALGTSIAYWIYVIVLVFLLKRAKELKLSRSLLIDLTKLILSALMMMAMVWSLKSLIPAFEGRYFIIKTLLLITSGVCLYLVTAMILGLQVRHLLARLLKKAKKSS